MTGSLRSGKAMSKYGTIVMGFLIFCLLLAVYFTTGVLKARSTWVTKIEKNMQAIEDADKAAKQAKKEFEDARNLVHWENDNWGRAWTAANSGPSPAGDGAFEMSVGTNAGLNQAKVPLVYLFGTGADGKSVYVGDFKLTEVRQDNAGGMLTRPPFANEVQGWPRGEYRVREQVPHNYVRTIDDLRTGAILVDQSVQHEQAMLVRQEQHIVDSQAALDERMGELNGKPDAPEKAGPDVKDGLVQTLRREEIARNELVKVVDAQRRELSDKHLKLTTVLSENQGNIQKLGGPARTKSPANRVAAGQ